MEMGHGLDGVESGVGGEVWVRENKLKTGGGIEWGDA